MERARKRRLVDATHSTRHPYAPPSSTRLLGWLGLCHPDWVRTPRELVTITSGCVCEGVPRRDQYGIAGLSGGSGLYQSGWHGTPPAKSTNETERWRRGHRALRTGRSCAAALTRMLLVLDLQIWTQFTTPPAPLGLRLAEGRSWQPNRTKTPVSL